MSLYVALPLIVLKIGLHQWFHFQVEAVTRQIKLGMVFQKCLPYVFKIEVVTLLFALWTIHIKCLLILGTSGHSKS